MRRMTRRKEKGGGGRRRRRDEDRDEEMRMTILMMRMRYHDRNHELIIYPKTSSRRHEWRADIEMAELPIQQIEAHRVSSDMEDAIL